MVSGRAELTYGQDRIVLEKGDSVYYNSSSPPSGCKGDAKAEIYAVLYFPE